MANRNIIEEFENKEVLNLALTRYDVEEINNILDKSDNIERIYINFCNPWPRGKHHKKRLTYTRQLEHYKEFLKNGGKIYFKTDDDNLFEESIHYFEDAGFKIEKLTRDLQKEPDFWENIETEHEKMIKEQGIKIKALSARK